MVLLAISPSLVKIWRDPRPTMITRWVAYAYTCGFMFGWHVHEKASLHFVIPLSVIALKSVEDAKHYFFLSIGMVASHFHLRILWPHFLSSSKSLSVRNSAIIFVHLDFENFLDCVIVELNWGHQCLGVRVFQFRFPSLKLEFLCAYLNWNLNYDKLTSIMPGFVKWLRAYLACRFSRISCTMKCKLFTVPQKRLSGG